ncbi:MAG: prenyltransferase/squalene oxidase repeat-containing protein [Planctomycetota bacterium]
MANDPATSDTAGWVTSLMLHAGLLALLAAFSLPDLPRALGPLLVAETADTEEADSDLILEEPPIDIAESVTLVELTSDVPIEAVEPAPAAAELNLPVSLSLSPTTLTAAIPSTTNELAGVTGVGGRGDATRGALLRAKGGTKASEQAVARGLRWIAQHQNADGTWSLVHNAGECRGRCGNPGTLGEPKDRFERTRRSATALALLPFLGAGETQQRGRYKRIVSEGINALVRLAKPNKDGPGASWTDRGTLYSHGLAAITLAEAYSMTRDERLRVPAQLAIDYIEYAQDPNGGGWRYRARQAGDTSVTGWQIMALKSAKLAELKTSGRTTRLARAFLDSVAEREGRRYRYVVPEPTEDGTPPEPAATRTLTAVGMLCRMYLGWKPDDARLEDAAAWIAAKGPNEDNYYYNYYAAQALFHYTAGEGPVWRKWNTAMRDQLVEQQSTRGHERGSWWIDENHNRKGGRLYTTSLATMTLEVYYRYLPIFQQAAIETEFPE